MVAVQKMDGAKYDWLTAKYPHVITDKVGKLKDYLKTSKVDYRLEGQA